MSKLFRTLMALFIVATVFMGFTQLDEKHNIFKESMELCCNNGLCNNRNCTYPSSVSTFESGCSDYSVNCYRCMDLLADGEVCNPSSVPPYTWCLDPNNNNRKYIGNGNYISNYTITFTASSPISVRYNVDGINIYTGSFSWEYGTSHDIYAPETVPYSAKYHYVFSSWSDGSKLSDRTLTVTGNLSLSASYTLQPITIIPPEY